jgi:hypothetical protein
MGKLLLQHLQQSAVAKEDLRIKNTFIHFSAAQQGPVLRRCRTEPCPEVGAAKSWAEPKDKPLSDDNDDLTEVDECCSTATSDMEDFQTDRTSKPPSLEDDGSPIETGSEGEATPRAAPPKETTPKWSEAPEDAESGDDVDDPRAESKVEEDPYNDQATTWQVDARKLKGRDTRVSAVLRLLVGVGPESLELVATIFPLPVSSKRGGACFKASNSIGRIQLKCNNPVDDELSVSISSGKLTQVQKHNFMTNPLMTFNGNWDFKTLVDADADRLALNLRLRLAEDGADLPIGHAMMDPAISAFSIGSGTPAAPEIPQVQSPHEVKANATVPGLKLSSAPRLASAQSTPDVSPRCFSPQTCSSSTTCTQSLQVSPASTFFELAGSVLFNFTLRRADGFQVGLDVSRDETNQELVVENVRAGGAVEAWNRQCFAGPYASKALVPTDRIVCVNSQTDCEGMLEECRTRQLLKIYVVRGDLPHYEIPFVWFGAPAVPAPVQFIPIPVPICFPIAVPCVKHGLVGFDNGTFRAPPEQLDEQELSYAEVVPTTLRAGAPEFCPSAQRQDGELDAASNDGA